MQIVGESLNLLMYKSQEKRIVVNAYKYYS